jgi:DNA-binding transcriptional LysR family regulator
MARTTLEQWRMLRAVVEHGGFAQASAAIHKSASSIHHAVHKLEDQLGLQLLEVVGRRVRLTSEGELMLRRAGQVLDQAALLEEVADSIAGGNEAVIRAAVDEIYPTDQLADALSGLAAEYPLTRVELREVVLSGGEELLIAGEVDLLISGSVPGGFLGDRLLETEFLAVAAPDHPLFSGGPALTLNDLRPYRQIVVRDSARGDRRDAGWLDADQRWTVSHVSTSIDMVLRGTGFAWLPRTRIGHHLQAGQLRPLPLAQGGTRPATLFLTFADPDRAGPAIRRLGALMRQPSQ